MLKFLYIKCEDCFFIEPSFFLPKSLVIYFLGVVKRERERQKVRNKLNKFIVDKLNREGWLECKLLTRLF